jgi:hypothetical protein
MAFPTIADADTTSGTQTSNSNSWTVTYCGNVATGDLLLLYVGTDGDSRIISATDWTELVKNPTTAQPCTLTVLMRRAPSALSGTFSLSLGANEQGCWRMHRVPAGEWADSGTLTNDVLNGDSGGFGMANGSSASPDPAQSDVSGDSADYLYLAFAVSDHGNTTYTAAPANYTDLEAMESGGANGAGMAIARRELNTSGNEDPGAFTADSEQWWATLIIVKPGVAAEPTRPQPIRFINQAVARASSWFKRHDGLFVPERRIWVPRPI